MLTTRRARAIAASVRTRIAACHLDLSGLTIATECANDAYAVTAAAAVAAGGEVWAMARDSRFSTVAQAQADVLALIAALGADPARLHVVTDRAKIPFSRVDLVTNSGHLRPIDADVIAALPDGAAIALMFEAWELRDGDIDVAAARQRAMAIAGVDEHHPACGSFEFVGPLAVSECMRARWSLVGAKVAIVADAAFAGPVARALSAQGAEPWLLMPDGGLRHPDVPAIPSICASEALAGRSPAADLAIVCATPAAVWRGTTNSGWTAEQLTDLALVTGAYGIVQLWGDLQRDRLTEDGVEVAPADPPHAGHQGVPMNAAGHEAVVRLQVAGLAAAAHVRTLGRGGKVAAELAELAQPIV